MKLFSHALLLAAMAATVTFAKKGKTFEANAFVTPKRDQTNGLQAEVEPYLKQNMLNLRQTNNESNYTEGQELWHDIHRTVATGGQEDLDTHIITTSDIDNYFNLQITTKLWFGSQQEPHDLILDTGSMWTWVQTKDCWSCGTHNNFDPKASETWQDLPDSDGRMMATGYGSGAVFGFAGTDQVCLMPDQVCADNHRIAAIVAETGLDTLVGDGILGLGPDTLTDMPKLFIDSLKEQGVIEQRMFSFLIGLDHNLPSKFMVGGYDLAKYTKGPIQWHSTLEPQKTWYLDWTGVKFGDATLELDPTVMLPDTGTSFISLPEKTMNNLLSIMHDVYGTGEPKLYPVGLWGAECTVEQFDAMPDLTFTIETTDYVISKHQYIINRNGHCVLQIAPTGDTGKAYLGINFFENYYGVFDMDNKRVGFAESIYSDLSEHQSITHSNQILLNMSSQQKLEYYMEAAGFDRGVEALVTAILIVSVAIGALIAQCILRKTDQDSESKQARKALANAFNNQESTSLQNEGQKQGSLLDDDMFDVPLNDARSYVGADVADEDMLTSQTSYAKAPSKPGRKTHATVKVGSLAEDEEYSFDVDL